MRGLAIKLPKPANLRVGIYKFPQISITDHLHSHITHRKDRTENGYSLPTHLILQNGCVNDFPGGRGHRGSGDIQGHYLPCLCLTTGQDSERALERAYFSGLDVMEAFSDAE